MNLYGSICLSDIPKECITTSLNNGKKYLNIYVNERQEQSQYGSTHYIKVRPPKDVTLPEGVKLYIGDLKTSQFGGQPQPAQPTQQTAPQPSEYAKLQQAAAEARMPSGVWPPNAPIAPPTAPKTGSSDDLPF